MRIIMNCLALFCSLECRSKTNETAERHHDFKTSVELLLYGNDASWNWNKSADWNNACESCNNLKLNLFLWEEKQSRLILWPNYFYSELRSWVLRTYLELNARCERSFLFVYFLVDWRRKREGRIVECFKNSATHWQVQSISQYTQPDNILFVNNNNIASCAIWLWNMVSYIKGGIQAKGIWKQDPEANIWA